MKKCIYHYPGQIQENPSSGSAVRPNRMLAAFKSLGYDVFEITGYSKERSTKIKECLERIRAGEKYEFVYSEATTMPTALADPDHLPRHPLMDEVFLRKCRKAGIPVGLFYRDAYWKFPLYRESAKWFIPIVTIPFYNRELCGYKKCTDVLFVPSIEFAEAIGYNGKYQELPPGGDTVYARETHVKTDDKISIFYVGGVNGLYDITVPVQVLSELSMYKLTICCSEQEWGANEQLQRIVANSSNIKVVHKKKHELMPYYFDSDITMTYFERSEYRALAMPVKLFEYIGYGKPVIATANTAAGRFVQDNDIGWVAEYNAEEFRKLLIMLTNSRGSILEKTNNTLAIIPNNTWEARAQTVIDSLKSM